MLNNHRHISRGFQTRDGKRYEAPLRVAVLCSHRAPGLVHLLNHCPDRGTAFDIVCAVTTETTFAEEVRVERRGIPTLAHPIREFCESRGDALFGDHAARCAYDAETLKLIEPYLPDLVLLDGYLYLITTPLLDAFEHRILNLHYSDLALRGESGGPRFPGVHAVRDALAAGCTETRTTVHLVDELPDDGTPIVRSWPYPVSPLVAELRAMDACDVFKAYAFAHQQWMMRTASGPLLAAALKLVSTGVVDLDELASVDPRDSTPWLLDRHGFLLAPEVGQVEQVGQ
jgi:phosphoribosylglycinamide formyltransferase-1